MHVLDSEEKNLYGRPLSHGIMPYARIGRQTFGEQLVVSFASKNIFGSSHVLCL